MRVAGTEAVGSWRAVRSASWAMRTNRCCTQCDCDRHPASHGAFPCDRRAAKLLPANDCNWRARMGCSGKRSHCDGRSESSRGPDSGGEQNPRHSEGARARWQRAQLRQAVRWRGRQGGRGDRGIRGCPSGKFALSFCASPFRFPLSAAPPRASPPSQSTTLGLCCANTIAVINSAP